MSKYEEFTQFEVEVYCDLLPIAYKITKQANNGFVRATDAEELRDEMYSAIRELF